MSRFPRLAGGVLAYIVLVLLVVISVVPLLLMVFTAFKPGNEIFQIPPHWLPTHPTLDNFAKVLFRSSIPRAALNSFITGLMTSVVALLLGGAAGYGFARMRFRGSRAMSLTMLASQLVPMTALIVPFYLAFDRLRISDSPLALAIGHLTIVLPLVTWMATSYFETIPKELEEAAMIDGTSRLGALWWIIIPLAAPGTIAIGIFAFLNSWNEFVLASVVTISERSRTLPVALTEFSTMFSTDWGGTMAAATLMTLPVVVAFFAFQRYFVQGLAAGAVK